MNSPWGLMFSIIEKTSYKLNDLMWKVRWINVQMMLADAPRYRRQADKTKEISTEEEFLRAFNSD